MAPDREKVIPDLDETAVYPVDHHFCTVDHDFCMVDDDFCTVDHHFCMVGNDFCVAGPISTEKGVFFD